MPRWGVPVLSAVMLIIAGFLLWTFIPRTGEELEIVLRPDDEVLVAQGAALYARECASCHGVNLEGQPNWRTRRSNGRLPAPPHNETGHTWHHSDEALFSLTKFGSAALIGNGYESDMPGYVGVLSDTEILAVLSFIKAQWPAQIRARHDQMNAAQQ